MRIRQVNAYATGSDEWASFLLNEEPVNCGSRGRPCALLIDDQVDTFPSVAHAAASVGVKRETVSRQVRQGRLARRRPETRSARKP